MEITYQETENKGRYFLNEGNKKIAEMTYFKAGDKKFIVDHTEVDGEYRGKNLGLKLVVAAVEYAR